MPKLDRAVSRITLANVARAAGVSVSTASLALRSSPRIGHQTRRKVCAVSRKLGYSANIRLAQPGRIDVFTPQAQIRNLGFILVGGDPAHPTYVQTFHSAAVEATGGGQHLFCYPSVERGADIDLGLLESADCDGFLLMGWVEDKHYKLLSKLGKPIVVLGDHRIPYPVNEVNYRWRRAGRAAVEYLASLGHRRIGLSCDDIRFLHRQEFWRGYREGMEAANLPVDDGWVQAARELVPHLEVVKPLFELAERPTAIIAFSQGEAGDVIGYAHSLGIRVPAELSVLYFGPRPVDPRRVAITFLEMPAEAFGRIGVKRLRELIGDPHETPLTTLLPLTLRELGTCGPAPGPIH